MYCTKCGNPFEGNFCPKCGHPASHPSIPQQTVAPPTEQPQLYPRTDYEQTPYPFFHEPRFHAVRLTINIITILLFFWIGLQSCAISMVDSIDGNTESLSGETGMFLAFGWLISGILGIAGRKSKSATRICAGLYALAGFVGSLDIGEFSDLEIYVPVSFILAIVFFLSTVLPSKIET